MLYKVYFHVTVLSIDTINEESMVGQAFHDLLLNYVYHQAFGIT